MLAPELGERRLQHAYNAMQLSCSAHLTQLDMLATHMRDIYVIHKTSPEKARGAGGWVPEHCRSATESIMLQCNAVQCNAMQCNAVQCSAGAYTGYKHLQYIALALYTHVDENDKMQVTWYRDPTPNTLATKKHKASSNFKPCSVILKAQASQQLQHAYTHDHQSHRVRQWQAACKPACSIQAETYLACTVPHKQTITRGPTSEQPCGRTVPPCACWSGDISFPAGRSLLRH